MPGELFTVRILTENTCFGEVDPGMENGEADVADDTKSKVSGKPAISTENVLPAESTNTNIAEDDLNDVKVCDICGDVGYEEVLVICSECNEGAEHIYCMQTLREAVPEGDWFCDDCKSKHMERVPRQPVNESQTPSALTHDTLKQVINDSTDLKISESGKSKLSSDKIEVQKHAQTSAVPSKRQIVDTNGASEYKKHATECVIVLVDESQSLLQSNSSSKLQETIRADNCGGMTETKIPQRPSYSREGPLKVSEAGKSNSCATSLLTHNNSLPRSLSRDNSFKTSETAKVKFLPTHTVASLCSGTTLRGSTKSAGVDGSSDVISPRNGMMNSNQTSCRGNPIAITDSTGHPANRSGHRSSFRQSSAYSSLQSAGLSKSGDVFPSFLLSSRNTNPSRVHSTLRNNKLVVGDNGLSEFTGNSTGSVGTTRSTLKRSSHIIPISTKVEKSITDISASPSVLKLVGSTPEELITVAKDNSHLALPSVEEKTSAVVSEVIQPHTLVSEELKGSAKDNQSMEGFPMINKVVEDILTRYTKDMDSVKEDSCWMKPIKGGVDLPHNDNGNLLSTSILVEKDGLTTPLESTRMESSMKDRAVPNVLKDQFPKVDDSSLIKEPTMLTLSNKDNKAPDITILKDNFTSRVEGDTILSVSNKKSAACDLDKQPYEEPAQQDSKAPDPRIPKDNFTSIVDDDTILSVSNKKSAACYLDKQPNEDLAIKTSKIFSSKGEVSLISPPLLEKNHNFLAEINHGKNDSKFGINLDSQLTDQGISDSSANASNEANGKPINEFCKDLFCNGGSLEKDTLPTASHVFVQADLVVMQSDKPMTQPPEKNISSFVVMPPKMLNPSTRNNFSAYSSNNYDTRAPLQGTRGSTHQKLGTWPESDFLWRGSFQVNDRISGCQIYDGMQAHPSNKASQKVYEVSSKFPPQLLLEQVRRIDAWPIRFTESPPTDEDIALYIFSIEMKSCQIRYSELLETTVKQDLALRVYLDCAELLIFSSNQLPQSYHRYNGEMYLWGVFRRRKIPSADPEQPFPDNSNVGGRFAQVNPSDVLVNNNLKLKQLYAKGHTEGEEDMDVDMEGGREIGTADGPTPRPESPISVSIGSNAMGAVALSNSKPSFRHHKNYRVPSEQGGISSVSTLSNSGKDLGNNPEDEEDMDVDMEGGREIGIAEIPTPRPQLANVALNNSMRSFILPNSKPILTQHENSRSDSCMPIENGLSLVTLWAGSGMNLGKVPEHMSRTDYVKDAERTNNRPSPDNTNNEPDFPPGFEVQRIFYHSPVITRNSSGMNIEAVPEKSNMLGIHAKLQQRELQHALVLPKDNMYSSDRSLSCGFSLHGQNCPNNSMLDREFPPGLEPPGMKPLVSPEYPPGLKMASMKTPVSSLDCPHGLEPTCMNPLVSNPLCRPVIVCPPVKPLVSEVEFPPGLEAVSVKPLASSPDCAPGLELACVKTLASSPDCPPGLKSSVKPITSSSNCPPRLESAVGNPNLFSLHSCGPETASRVRVLSSSECMPGRESASGNSSKRSFDYPLGSVSAAQKPLVTASDHSLENSAMKQQVQDKSHNLLQNKVESSSQRYTYLSPGKEDKSRNHSKPDHASGRRGVKRSYSFASLTREDEDRKASKMSKSKSFKEELYNDRNSSRGKEDWRERSRSSNEKDYNRRRDSSREKDHREEEGRREGSKKHGRENEGKKGSGNYSRDEEDKRKRDKRYREEEHAGDRYRGHHRYWNMLSEPRRHKDHEKHSNSSSRYRSPSESTTYSGSPSRGKYRRDATRKIAFGHRANSSYSDSSIEHNFLKRSSLNEDSKNGGKAPTVSLHNEKAIMDMDSAQVPRSQPFLLENKDNGNRESGEMLADYDHFLLCNQNDDAVCTGGVPEENNLGATSQQAMEVNLSGKASGDEDQILSGIVNDKIDHQVRDPDENDNRERASQEASGVNLSGKVSADHDHILLCYQNDDAVYSHGVPEENNLGATSQQASGVNLSGMVSAYHDHILLCNQNDDAAACSHEIPEENNLGATSQQAMEVNLLGKASGDTDQILSGVVNDKTAHQLSVPDEKNNGETTSQEAPGVNLFGKVSADYDHILLCDLNNEATCDCGVLEDKNLGEAAFHEPMEVNVSDTINLRTCYVSSHSGQGEQHTIPLESNSCADSRLTIDDSVKCLQLFPIKGDCGVAETTTDHLDFNLQLGLEHWTPSKEPLPLLEQSSWQSRSLTFMFDNGASSSGSKSVCDDSREASPPVGSILSLSMPRYRKQGNTWIEVNEESELSEEREADVKLSLSMF